MKLLIDKSCFASGKYLFIEDSSYSWKENPEKKSDLFLSLDRECSLNKFISLYGQEPIEFLERKYLKMMESLNTKKPDWKSILPTEKYHMIIRNFQENLKNTKNFLYNERYFSFFSKGNEILNNLSPIKPDSDLLNSLIKKEENPTLKGILKSFSPENNGFCSVVSYDRLKTVTGRLVVKNGPQVLLLPKNAKKVITSRYGKDGAIVWVDYVSLEPRFTKLLNSDTAPLDIYNDIIASYDLNLDRKKVKLAVLAILFGAGVSKITEIVGRDAIIVKKAISEYFAFKDILNATGEYSTGKIKNYFGRPIKLKKSASNVAINNFVQSSSVDVALMGFSKLELPKSAKPIAVIHDALVVDVLKEDLHQLASIIKKGVSIEEVGHFHLGFEVYEV